MRAVGFQESGWCEVIGKFEEFFKKNNVKVLMSHNSPAIKLLEARFVQEREALQGHG